MEFNNNAWSLHCQKTDNHTVVTTLSLTEDPSTMCLSDSAPELFGFLLARCQWSLSSSMLCNTTIFHVLLLLEYNEKTAPEI